MRAAINAFTHTLSLANAYPQSCTVLSGIAILLVMLTAIPGCATSNRGKTDAVIGDTPEYDFNIGSVDGEVPTQWSHRFVTVEPSIVVSPGIHTFGIEGTKQTFVAKVEPGKAYEPAMRDGVPVLAEVTDSETPAAQQAASISPKD